MGVKGKAAIIEKKRLQCYGHIKRITEERITELWNGYHWREGKEDVQEKLGWKEYKQP